MHQISFDELKAQVIPTPVDVLMDTAPTDEILTTISKHYTKFKEYDGGPGEFKNIMVSISGGADSDRVIDLIERIGYPEGAVHYVYFNTGMEYRATIRHLEVLRKKYGVQITEFIAKTPVPVAVKKWGVPVFSKAISQYIMRLQKHGFQWEDKPFDVLLSEYPKCKAALRWWCNQWGEKSRCNISRKKYLKEFMIQNPPDFRISDKCCQKAKKDTAAMVEKLLDPDLSVIGVRKAEGGSRASAYHTCFDDNAGNMSALRLLFWWKKEDCLAYDDAYDVCHSDCYKKYGLDRTGCACCVYGKYWEKELAAAREYEPALYKVAMKTFSQSYSYMLKYKEFCRNKNEEGSRHSGEILEHA